MANDPTHPVFEALDYLYAQIDRHVETLSRFHAERLVCAQGCCDCCIDGVTVFEVEARNIQRHYGQLLYNEQAHPEPGCAFLDGRDACCIYAQRPYVCRTQGLPLRWLEEDPQGTVVEMRDICTRNDRGKPIEELSADQCWTIGPAEQVLAELQERLSPGEGKRIALRSLFAPTEGRE